MMFCRGSLRGYGVEADQEWESKIGRKGWGSVCKAHHLPAAPRASRYSTQSGCPMEAASCRESPLVVLVDGLDVQVPGVNQIGQDVPAAVARNVCRRVSRAGPAKPARPVAYSSSHPAPTSTPAADAEAQSWPPARVRRERPATLPRAHPAPSGPRLRDPPPAPPCLSGPFPRRPDLPPPTLRFRADHATHGPPRT